MLIWLMEYAAAKCYRNSTLKNQKSKILRFGPTLTCYISRLERHPALKFWLLSYLDVGFQKVQKNWGIIFKVGDGILDELQEWLLKISGSIYRYLNFICTEI